MKIFYITFTLSEYDRDTLLSYGSKINARLNYYINCDIFNIWKFILRAAYPLFADCAESAKKGV